MKQLIFALLFLSSIVRADAAPPPPDPTLRYIQIHNKITNIDDYNLTFLLCDISANPGMNIHYMSCEQKILNNEEINTSRGFMYWSKRLLIVPTDIYNQNDHADMLKEYEYPRESSPAIVSKAVLFTRGFQYHEGENYTENNETRLYSITSVTDNNVTLKLDRRLIYFKDGSTKTITY